MAKAKKQFKSNVADIVTSRGVNALIPTGPEEITDAQLRKLARQRKAAGIGQVGRPKRTDKDNETASAAEKGTKPGEMRKTYLVSKEQADKLDRIAYWQRQSVKETLAAALQTFIAAYERKNGPAKAIPKK